MTVNPNSFVMTILAEQRGAELQAQAARDHLAELAQSNRVDQRRKQRPDPRVMVAIMAGFALLLAAGAAAAPEPAHQAQQGLVQAAAHAAAPASATEFPGTSAVQKVREAAN